MFELNKKLEAREAAGNPIRIALIGVGTMGTLFACTVGQAPGMEITIVADLKLESAKEAQIKAGAKEEDIVIVSTIEEAEAAFKAGKRMITKDLKIACALSGIEAVYESTGMPEVWARTGFEAINHKKHFLTMSVEGDVCAGTLMAQWAKNAGVVYSGTYGDEPGSAMLQYYEAKALGFEVLAIGRSDQGGTDIKWNKETVVPEVKKANGTYKNMAIMASFWDGSKANQECTMMANATGLCPDVRGMHMPCVEPGPEFVQKVPGLLQDKAHGGILEKEGVVELIADPRKLGVCRHPDHIWVFVVVRCKSPEHINWLVTAKGVYEGDVGMFYCPYHMGSVQSPITVAKAVLEGVAVCAPMEKRSADSITMAKRDLKAGHIIDEIGGFDTTARIEKASIVRKENLLPFALACGAKLKRDIKKEEYITYDDVEFPENTLLLQMRRMQETLFEDLH